VKRSSGLAVLAALFGLAVVGCGAGSSAAPTSSKPPPSSSSTTAATTAGSFTGSATSWLSSVAGPWSGRLNRDQQAVDSASSSTKSVSAAVYFARLKRACTALSKDAGGAEALPTAPSAQLDQAWKAMAAQTQAYADACLTLARTHANADLTAWQNSLKLMNSANASLNTVVDAVRGTAGSTTPSG
jgi:hypothetical protein